MTRTVFTGALVAALALAGCENMTSDQRMVVGGLTGAAAGVFTADAFDANRNWTVISALTGAAIGSVVASNNVTQECAYVIGDGTYRVGPCP